MRQETGLILNSEVNIMKKIVFLILVISALAVCSCNKKDIVLSAFGNAETEEKTIMSETFENPVTIEK